MNATFLVTVNLDDTDLITISNEMKDFLDDHFDVIEVKPWHRDNLPMDPASAAFAPPPPIV